MIDIDTSTYKNIYYRKSDHREFRGRFCGMGEYVLIDTITGQKIKIRQTERQNSFYCNKKNKHKFSVRMFQKKESCAS